MPDTAGGNRPISVFELKSTERPLPGRRQMRRGFDAAQALIKILDEKSTRKYVREAAARARYGSYGQLTLELAASSYCKAPREGASE